MKTQPWIELSEDFFVDPVVIEAARVRRVEGLETTWYIVRLLSSNGYYDSHRMFKDQAQNRLAEIMDQLVPK